MDSLISAIIVMRKRNCPSIILHRQKNQTIDIRLHIMSCPFRSSLAAIVTVSTSQTTKHLSLNAIYISSMKLGETEGHSSLISHRDCTNNFYDLRGTLYISMGRIQL